MIKNYKWYTYVITASFLLCGFLHCLLYGRDFADIFTQVFTGAVVIAWVISVQRRVTDEHLKKLLTAVSFVLLLYLLVQAEKYRFVVDHVPLLKIMWYMFYVCMTAAAVLVFYVADGCFKDRSKKEGLFYYLPLILGILISLGILTNDFHFLLFSFFKDAVVIEPPEKYGPLFYTFYVFMFSLLMISFAIVLRKHRYIKVDIKDVMPQALPLILIVTLMTLTLMGKGPRINGIAMWNMGELFCFDLIIFLELLISLGLIPANTGYEELFELADLSAVILGKNEDVKYLSSSKAYPFKESEDSLIMSKEISGGEIRWALDIEALNKQNSKLEETLQSIDARNSYLSFETKIKKERTEVEERNRIYDNITRIVRPQLDGIKAFMDEGGRNFDEKLKDISVLCAYIKRRSNMELLSENGMLPLEELSLALSESLSYLDLKNVETAVSVKGTGDIFSDAVIAAYELSERIIESCLETLKALMISVRRDGDDLSMRMMVSADSISLPPIKEGQSFGSYKCFASASKEGSDMILSFEFRKGGPRL